MPEIRKDPVVGRWVIISTERANRPLHYGLNNDSSENGCPFCAGNEDKTPPELLVFRDKTDSSTAAAWNVRVVPNKYPALVAAEGKPVLTGKNEAQSGVGAHEVIIESPHHATDMALLSETQFRVIVRAYHDRMKQLRTDRRFRYILIYKNQGVEAGATLEHVHSQIIALPGVPARVTEEIQGSKDYYELNKRCVFCEMIRGENGARQRLVTENSRFIALCPFAPRFGYEVWILPKTHSSVFEATAEQDAADLGDILRDTLLRMGRCLGNPPFNYFIHSNPLDESANDHYHWHLEIFPKLIQVGGFEWGTGWYIHTVTPEQSARALREAIL
jgi:UDPglucose--hexose-1-phosphate uridylyltransferase